MSRLDIVAEHIDTLSISAQRQQNLGTGTAAAEDRAEVLCLWAKADHHGIEFPLVCPLGASCCLVSDKYWPSEHEQPPRKTTEQTFS